MTDPATLTPLGDGWVRGELRVLGDGTTIENARRPSLPFDADDYRIVDDLGVTMIVEWHQSAG